MVGAKWPTEVRHTVPFEERRVHVKDYLNENVSVITLLIKEIGQMRGGIPLGPWSPAIVVAILR